MSEKYATTVAEISCPNLRGSSTITEIKNRTVKTEENPILTRDGAKITCNGTCQFLTEMKEFRIEMRANYAEALNINRHVHNLTVAAMVGIGAMALSGGAIAVAVVYSVLSK